MVVNRQAERLNMVETQIEFRGVKDGRVLEAMRKIPRERYMPDAVDYLAYADRPVPIGYEQTISQPYIVALMTELLQVEPPHKVLEIGTGSGYQAAVLAEIGVELYTIEIVCELAEKAEKVLKEQGYPRVNVICGDGYKGWPEHAPFDRIIGTAAPPELPQALVDQLKEGGIMVVPVGDENQDLNVITKRDGKITVDKVLPVRFVPMVQDTE
jgi:protein-L-isoaspartate(D-aspartate) O-methyltransferase